MPTFTMTAITLMEIKNLNKVGASKFYEFLSTEQIEPAIHAGWNRNYDSFCGALTTEDAIKIEAWLLEQGAEHK